MNYAGDNRAKKIIKRSFRTMDKKKINIGKSDIILIVISVVFLIGILTVFAPCGPKEDGAWMSCHWAGHAVAGAAAVLVVLSVIHLFIADAKIKTGISIAIIPVSILAAIIPDGFISLCMMNTMRCHSVMHPAAIVMAILTVAAALLDIFIQRKNK